MEFFNLAEILEQLNRDWCRLSDVFWPNQLKPVNITIASTNSYQASNWHKTSPNALELRFMSLEITPAQVDSVVDTIQNLGVVRYIGHGSAMWQSRL